MPRFSAACLCTARGISDSLPFMDRVALVKDRTETKVSG